LLRRTRQCLLRAVDDNHLRRIADHGGVPACATVNLVDGLVLKIVRQCMQERPFPAFFQHRKICRKIGGQLKSFLLLVFLGVCSRLAHACTCAQSPPLCQTLHEFPDIFVGKVLDKTPLRELKIGNLTIRTGYRYTLEVERVFRGESSHEVIVQSGVGGGDCGYVFTPGQTYTIFGGHSENGEHLISTTICTPTAPWSADSEKEIETVYRNGGRNGRIFGTVSELRHPEWEYLKRPGIRVELHGASPPRHVTTGAEGQYSFNRVPPGEYRLSLALSKEYELEFPVENDQEQISVIIYLTHTAFCAKISESWKTNKPFRKLFLKPFGIFRIPMSALRS
jgi:hypothetical protein